jgi:hypothetical protein
VQLTVSTTGTGDGSVTSSPAGIDCGATCQFSFVNGTTVTLTAIAAAGWTFTGWSDPTCQASTTCTVSLVAARSLTAFFTLNPVVPAPPLAVDVPLPVVSGPVAPATPVVKTVVQSRPVVRTLPKISGRKTAGSTLTCSRGTWSGSPSRYVFTWRRDGKVVGHAARYVVRTADRGHGLQCSVTASNAKGASTATSLAVRIPR